MGPTLLIPWLPASGRLGGEGGEVLVDVGECVGARLFAVHRLSLGTQLAHPGFADGLDDELCGVSAKPSVQFDLKVWISNVAGDR